METYIIIPFLLWNIAYLLKNSDYIEMDKEIIHNTLSSREILYQCSYISL